MEKGLQLGNLSISLVLLLLLKALTGTAQSSAGRRAEATAALGSETVEDGPDVMERALESVGAPVTGDVTVEDDENGPAEEEDAGGGDEDARLKRWA